jgi:ribosome recycling factor
MLEIFKKKGEISEDQKHKDELSIQEITNLNIEKIDNFLSIKEKEVLET